MRGTTSSSAPGSWRRRRTDAAHAGQPHNRRGHPSDHRHKNLRPHLRMRMFSRSMIEEFALNLNYGPEPDTLSFLLKQAPAWPRFRWRSTSGWRGRAI